MSHLFMKTTMRGRPTWAHGGREGEMSTTAAPLATPKTGAAAASRTCFASRTCSRVCGMGPSGAETTRIAPSMHEAPVIMFLT
eukprot:scaffold18052_cov28-Tisochrysis_lutea.AAC.5